MKKNVFHVGIMALALLFVFAGCGDDEFVGRGNITQVHGVVYDSVTLQPLQNVLVSIAGSTVRTNAQGFYQLRDLTVGDYEVTFTLDGYRIGSVQVDANATSYTTDDPFLEAAAFNAELDALKAFVKTFPELDVAHVFNDPSWSYEAGTWTSSEGISVFNGTSGFQVGENKLNFTYRKETTRNVALVPLTGAYDVTIKLIPFAYPATNVTIDSADIIDIPADVEIRFTDGGSGTDSFAAGQVFTGTTVEGGIEKSGLPINTELGIALNTFEHEGIVYDTSTIRIWDGSAFVTAAGAIGNTTAAGTPVTLYVFAGTDFATVATITSTAIAPNGRIVLTFSEAMDPAGFSVALAGIDGNIASGSWAGDLSYNWVNATTVEITKDTPFPYSRNAASPSGRLGTIVGTSVNGNPVYTATAPASADDGLPIFTVEGMQLVSADWAPAAAEIPSVRATLVRTPAVKLTFNKDVSPFSTIEWSNGTTHVPAEFTIGTDKKVVWVWTDTLIADTSVGLRFNSILNANDLTDVITSDPGANGLTRPTIGTEAIEWAKGQRLFLASTTIGRTVTDQLGNTPATAISLTFTRAIPEGATIAAYLTANTSTPNAGNTVQLTTSHPTEGTPAVENRAILNITPRARLNYNTEYYLVVVIENADGDPLFDATDLPLYENTLFTLNSNDRIHFRTVVDPNPVPVQANVRGPGTNSGTNDVFTSNGSNGINQGSTNIKLGVPYFIEFTAPHGFRAPATFPPLTGTGFEGNITFTMARVTDTIVSITFNRGTGFNATAPVITINTVTITSGTAPADANFNTGAAGAAGDFVIGAFTEVLP